MTSRYERKVFISLKLSLMLLIDKKCASHFRKEPANKNFKIKSLKRQKH